MMRVENIGDIFNSKGQLTFQVVDLHHLTSGLFELVNGVHLRSEQIAIEETSLTGNQPYDLMVKNKIKWTTVDDIVSKSAASDANSDGIALQ